MRWMNNDDNSLFSAAKAPTDAPSANLSASISVSELNRRVKGLLEANLPLRWVRGELSNVMRAASGHWYFSLKDDLAQVRCVMFKSRAQAVTFTPENGLAVEVRALPSLYEARGEFQLGVESMRRSGLGALFEAFERLKAKLAAEGLFDVERKRSLPNFPRGIGIVTSPKAAALRDVLTTLKRRAPMIPIIIYPTAVQGADAPREIAAAINVARTRQEVDALLICRGGGAMEDLWAFNDEAVARAIYRLQMETDIVVVSGVGHETDFTITDFVADLRAPTPTAGAELLSPDTAQLRADVAAQKILLMRTMRRLLHTKQQQLDFAARGLVSPEERLQRERMTLNQYQLRLSRALRGEQQKHRERVVSLSARIKRARPNTVEQKQTLALVANTLRRAITNNIQQHRYVLSQHTQAFNLLNPDNVLTRGYAIISRANDDVITSINGVAVDDTIQVRLRDGRISALVTEKR
jgi:exodeoxyribonuclease VII large subunit